MSDDHDPVNHPRHYTAHPSGVECIEITRWLLFDVGNALKYVWRADLKNGAEDLAKAEWYLNDVAAHPEVFMGAPMSEIAVTLLIRVADAEPDFAKARFYRLLADERYPDVLAEVRDMLDAAA